MNIDIPMAIRLAAMAIICTAQQHQTENNWFVSWEDIRDRIWIPDDNMEEVKVQSAAICYEICKHFDDIVQDIAYDEETEEFDVMLYGDALFYDSGDDEEY